MHPWLSTSPRRKGRLQRAEEGEGHGSRRVLRGARHRLELEEVNLSARGTSNPARPKIRSSIYESAKFPCWYSGSGAYLRPGERMLGRWEENPGSPLTDGTTRSRLVQAPLPACQVRIHASVFISRGGASLLLRARPPAGLCARARVRWDLYQRRRVATWMGIFVVGEPALSGRTLSGGSASGRRNEASSEG